MGSFFHKAGVALRKAEEDARRIVDSAATDITNALKGEIHSHTHLGGLCHKLQQTVDNRYHGFAPPRTQDSAKWFVDGCSYFWALSVALEEAQHSIWTMDWWLSPELYLRRPPSANEQYRLGRMLKTAADRGVKINVMIYKEVENVLTLSSVHTKRVLEALSKNISVFRHPNHNPSGREILSDFRGLFLHPRTLSELPQQSLEALYGLSDDVILFWAHHEKLLIIDGKMAFMGGLDACFGRWDTNQHPIADAHPNNPESIIFPGQDYNNARIYDFEDVSYSENNKLDRAKSARMGWSDVSICLQGPIVEDLRAHFVQRWNFIYNDEYSVINERHYEILTMGQTLGTTYNADGSNTYIYQEVCWPTRLATM